MASVAVAGTVPATTMAWQPTRKTLLDKILYGVGSIAFGVKDNGFNVLLLLFYNQALGVPAKLVGFAIMIALIVDAIADPLVGYWSDSVRSRLGRRHPFMYAAALPVAVSYFFLWNPPAGLSQTQLFEYLLGLSIAIRLCISLYEIPSGALVVDMAEHYDERTSFLSFRYFFGWVGGLSMGIAAFSLFLRPSANDPSGQLNLTGYSHYGLTTSLVMLAAILISCIGTQRHIASFRPPEPRRPFDLHRTLREVGETLSHRPFLLLVGSGFFSYAAVGVGYAMITYSRLYFWQLSGDQISLLMVGNFASVVAALFLTPWIGRKLGKKRGTILLSIIGMVVTPLMYAGRLLDIVPPQRQSIAVLDAARGEFRRHDHPDGGRNSRLVDDRRRGRGRRDADRAVFRRAVLFGERLHHEVHVGGRRVRRGPGPRPHRLPAGR